jgi:hypothetical protein
MVFIAGSNPANRSAARAVRTSKGYVNDQVVVTKREPYYQEVEEMRASGVPEENIDLFIKSGGQPTRTMQEIPQQVLTASSLDKYPALKPEPQQDLNQAPATKGSFYWFDIPVYAGEIASYGLKKIAPESSVTKVLTYQVKGGRDISRVTFASGLFAPVTMTSVETMAFYNKVSPEIPFTDYITRYKQTGENVYTARTQAITTYKNEKIVTGSKFNVFDTGDNSFISEGKAYQLGKYATDEYKISSSTSMPTNNLIKGFRSAETLTKAKHTLLKGTL